MNRKEYASSLLASAGAIVIGLSYAATAQSQAAAEPSETAQPSASPDLEEVTVTAQRREENVQSVPIAITVVTPEQMQDFGMTQVDDIDLITPGLTMRSSDAALSPYIRGIGTTAALAGLEPAVASYFDGAYLPQTLGVLTDMFDMASVEVLKGAQGTLWGSNASGGAILYNTANPVMNEYSAKVSAEYGNYNHALAEGVFNVPLSDTLAARVGVHGTTYDGYVTNIVDGRKLSGRDNVTARGKLKWEPSDNFTALLSVDYYATNDDSNFRTMRSSAPLCGPCVMGVGMPAPGFYQTSVNGTRQGGESNSFSNTATGEILKLNYAGSWFDLSSMTSYRRNQSVGSIDVGNSTIALFDFLTNAVGKTFDQEVQLTTQSEGIVNGTVGLSYIHDKTTFDGDYTGIAFAPLLSLTGAYPHSKNLATTSSYAGFGEIYLTPIDRLKITAGARYTRIERELSTDQNLSASIALAGDPASPQNFETSANFTKLTPRLVVAYDLDSVNVYASYNRGFKSGGFSTPAYAPAPAVLPETVDSYELGAKYVSPDSRFKLDQSIFYYKYSDIQVTIIKNVSSPTVVNAASARGYGAELAASYQAASWLKVFGNAAYLDATYTSFPDAALAVVSASGGLENGVGDLTDRRLPNAPKTSGSVGFNLNAPVSRNFAANLNLVAHYTDDYDLQPGAGGPLGYAVQPSYTLVNISSDLQPTNLSPTSVIKDYRIGFYVTNATDEKYYNGRFAITGPFGGLLDQVGTPRMYGVRLTASF